jgi:hypothetical protein
MNTSEVIERLKKDKNISLYSSDNPRKIGEPDEEMVTKAYNQYCEMWNANEKSRGFIKYLIHNFLPIKPENKMFSYSQEDIENGKNRCCILKIRLANISDIAEYASKVGMQRILGSAKAYEEGRTKLPKEQWEEIKRLRREAPIEVKTATIGYVSEDDNKYLSNAALLALQMFVNDALFGGEKEIEFTIKKIMVGQAQAGVKKEKRLDGKQINKVAARTVYGAKDMIDDETLNKLKGLKEELEKGKK